MLALYEVERHGTQALNFGGHDARECGLSNSSGALFLLGYPERAFARNAEGITHALALGQPQVVAHAHNWGAMLLQLAGDLEELDRRATLLARLANEHGLAMYYPEARILAAWRAIHQEGDPAPPRRCEISSTDARPWVRSLCTPISSCCWPTLGCSLADRTRRWPLSRRVWLAPRREASISAPPSCTGCTRAPAWLSMLATVMSPRLISTLRSPPPVTNRHASSSFEPPAILRGSGPIGASGGTPTTCWRRVYGWFTEGFNTADLKNAKTLLGELA